MTARILTVRDLSVRLPAAGADLAVVDRVGFELAAGEIVALVGESGCGKTLTAAALLGIPPEPGGRLEIRTLKIAGREYSSLDERGWRNARGRDIALVSQDPLTALDPVIRTGTQLVSVLRRHGIHSRGEAAAKARELLGEVGLPDPAGMMRRFPHQLSGGMRQRVLIAMALSCDPAVVVADEPTTALDVTTQAEILHLLRTRARDRGTAILLVTHDLSLAARVCDRILVMYGGRIVEQGPAASLFESPAHPYTAGLMAAVPQLTGGDPPVVKPLPGQVPAPGHLPPGCGFNNRCPRADTICRKQEPELTTSNGAHLREVACHRPQRPGEPGNPS
ncbi:ABC transporter ATP-binding protein [Elongatibacter sediminis]|uniref:ABC-type dipeptide transporter n=1 Tax=Elongatibacter sediminis TaxID=3119006 RepID=A0AAW9RHZ5_9GAMM